MNFHFTGTQITLPLKYKSLTLAAIVGLVAILMPNCSTTRIYDGHSPSQQRQRVVQEASKFLGSPYRYGGSTRSGFDCSGLVYRSYQANGIQVPRTSTQQYRSGKPIDVKQSQPGDLIFFTQKGKINHVALVTRTNRHSLWVVHSTTRSGVIKEDIMASSYWRHRIKGARNLLD